MSANLCPRLPVFEAWLALRARVDLAWCVVICQAGREKAVQAELALAGWSTYQPMQTVWLKPSRLKRRVNRPLFARYLFAAVNEGGDPAVMDRAIDGLVTVRRAADGRSAVRPDLLARLMITEAGHGLDLTYEKPRVAKQSFVCGETVRVRAGVMAGFNALILKVLSEREVRAQFMLFGRPGEATFAVTHLEAA